MAQEYELIKKVCLLGDPGVGKTSLVRRFVTDIFDDHYLSTIGAKITKKGLDLDIPGRGLKIKLTLMIWDVAGQKEYRAFHEMHMKGMEGVLAVADLTRKNTFESLKATLAMAERTGSAMPIVFLLNKADLAEPTPTDLKDVRTLASSNDIPVLAVSAKTGLNVEMAFERLSRLMVEHWAKKKFDKDEEE